MTSLEIQAVKFRNKLNQLFPSSKKEWFCSAIITAAGSGIRMGGVSKQLLSINERPCIAYSLIAFQNCAEIDEIVVVAKQDEAETIEKVCRTFGIDKLKAVVIGGKTRQESVSLGFSAVSGKSDLVAIHDAARPLILPSHISELIRHAKRFGAAAAAMPMVDSVKRGDKNGMLVETVPREGLFTVQTPQVFHTDLYRVSLAIAEKDGFSVTDDTSLAEHAGFSVKLCEVAPINVKLTTSGDLAILSTLLKERENE